MSYPKTKVIKIGLIALLLGFVFLSQLALTQDKKLPKEEIKKEQIQEKIEPTQTEVNQTKKEKKIDTSMTLMELFELGGIFMWPLLLFSIITLGVIIERSIVFMMQKFDIKKIGAKIQQAILEKNYAQAIEICCQKRSIGSEIFGKNLALLSKNIADFEKAVEASASVKVFALEKNLNILSSMSNIAPLTGFLGTVSGMITSFKTIALSDNVTASSVAGGIYEALITTEVGLVIAILAVLGNNYFAHRISAMINEVEETAMTLVRIQTEVKHEN